MTPPIAFARKIFALLALATRTVLRVTPPTVSGFPHARRRKRPAADATGLPLQIS
jgi:hypothetical protein